MAYCSLSLFSLSPVVHVAVSDDDDVDQAGTSESNIDRSVGNLAAVFPGIPTTVVRNAVITYGSAERAVNSLLSYRSTEESSPRSEGSSSVYTQESESLSQVLQRLRAKMSARGMREKIKIDPDDQVMDVFSYYWATPTGKAQLKIWSFIGVRNGISMGRLFSCTFSLASSRFL